MTTIAYTFLGILLATLVGVVSFMYVDGAGARSTGEGRSVATVAAMMIERVNAYQDANGTPPATLDDLIIERGDSDADFLGMTREGVIAGIPDARWISDAGEGEVLSKICLSVPIRYRASLLKAQPLLQGTRGVAVSDRCGLTPLPERAVLQLAV